MSDETEDIKTEISGIKRHLELSKYILLAFRERMEMFKKAGNESAKWKTTYQSDYDKLMDVDEKMVRRIDDMLRRD